MSPETLEKVKTEIVRARSMVMGCDDFIASQDLRSLYVVLLTTEGAVRFGDLCELEQTCIEFCERKGREPEPCYGNGEPEPA